MPAKVVITREAILNAAVGIVREDSAAALSARTLASRLSCSTQPIFSNFANMDELREAVKAEAWGIYLTHQKQHIASGKYTPFKASGMAYIAFAVDEPQLFRLLFMPDTSADLSVSERAVDDNVVDMIVSATGLPRRDAERFHENMWIFVHGIASMVITGLVRYDEDDASQRLSDMYNSLLEHIRAE